jgi:hypothetical protein
MVNIFPLRPSEPAYYGNFAMGNYRPRNTRWVVVRGLGAENPPYPTLAGKVNRGPGAMESGLLLRCSQ